MRYGFLLGLLIGLLLPWRGQGQTYFNTRYALSPVFSAATNILPVGDGYWLGGIMAAPPPSQGRQALFLQRLDATGQLNGPLKQWSAPTVSYGIGVANALFGTADGGLALAGTIRFATNEIFGHLWRFTAQGDTLWTRTYGNGTAPSANGVIVRNGRELPDGGFVLIGEQYTLSPVTGYSVMDLLLLRTDAQGRELWRRTYDVQRFELGLYLLATADGGFVLSGDTWEDDGPDGAEKIQGLVVKVDATGQEQWRTLFGGPASDLASSVLATPDGGYVVGAMIGQRERNGRRYGWLGLVWLDSAGRVVRQRTYGKAKEYTNPYPLHRLADGGYILSGQQLDTASALRSQLIRTCADGDSVWMRSYYILPGPKSENYLRDMKPTADGGFVAAGFVAALAPDTGPQSAWVFKTDANGYLRPGGAPPGITCRPVGLPEAETDTGVEVWPNPAPDGRFLVRAPGAALTVCDALGRVVWRGPAAGPETRVDLARHPPGLYQLHLTWPDGRTATRRLVR